MCGIGGIFTRSTSSVDANPVAQMMAAQRHRGPDDFGMAAFVVKGNGLDIVDDPAVARAASGAFAVLGHHRLSILDLSAAGHQPMASPERDLWITYNGEIYNFPDLRAQLEVLGHSFRSRTDTEVLLHAYAEWGPSFVERLNGIFAFALLDVRDAGEPRLMLARDRFGVKPLYFTWVEDELVFASELKAILAHPRVPRRLSAAALDQFLAFLWVPEPRTILADVQKVPPGHWLMVERGEATLTPYWRLRLQPEPEMREETAAQELKERLSEACVRQTLSDVPVAAFLSGGLDSTAIVSLLARAGQPPVRAFTVGFDAEEQRFEGFPDDLPYAERVAAELGIPLSASRLRADMAAQLPELVRALDEPLADPAILPLYEMCVAARSEGIKVLLSGMGGDELFGGYRRHAVAPVVDAYRRLPTLVRRRLILRAVEGLPSAGRGRLAPTIRRAKRFLRGVEHESGSPYVGLATWATEKERKALYAPGTRAALAAARAWDAHLGAMRAAGAESLLQGMLAGDATVYLPSHNLNYTDKIGMAASVEIRVPFLDNDVVDLAACIPDRLKVKGTNTKFVLKRAMRGVVPDEVLRRGKAGLGAPIRAWLVGPLRSLLDEHLSRERVLARGLFDADAVERARADLESGREDTSYLLWALLTLEMWMTAYDVHEVSA